MADETRLCPHCGTPNLTSNLACYHCGQRLPWAALDIADDMPDYQVQPPLVAQLSRAELAMGVGVGIVGAALCWIAVMVVLAAVFYAVLMVTCGLGILLLPLFLVPIAAITINFGALADIGAQWFWTEIRRWKDTH